MGRSRGPSNLPRCNAFWLLIAVVLVVAGYVLFARSLGFVVESFQQPEFSHGYIIPLISGWTIWERRHLIWAQRRPGAWSGWLVAVTGAAFAVACHAAELHVPPYLGLLVILVGLPAAVLGWAAARFLVVPISFLMFAYPLPDYLYIELSTSLQLVSSTIGAGLLDTVGVPVFLDGNIIDLGAMQLQVAEACSGLRYLLPLVSFGVLCAYMYRAPVWAKFTVLAVSVPLAIALNGARIAATGLFVHYGSTSLAEGFMHFFEGWVVFVIALAMLFGLMYALLRCIGWRGRFVDMLDFERIRGTPDGIVPPMPAAAAPAITTPPRPLLVATGFIALMALLLLPLEWRPQMIPERPPLLSYPMLLGEMRGTPSFIPATTEDRLGADDYVLADFTGDGDVPKVNLWVAYYEALINGRYFHSPTTCLPGAGWEYVEFGAGQTTVVDLAGQPLVVNRGVIVHGAQRIVMYFWMELRGRSVHNLQHVKFFNLWDSLRLGRSDGALVRMYTPLEPGEPVAAGDARLLEFLERAYPHLEPHVGV